MPVNPRGRFQFKSFFVSVSALCLVQYFAVAATHHELYQEYPEPNEQQQFAQFAQEIQDIQKTLANGMSIERAFHSKAHGCLNGTFTVLTSIPEDAKFGPFIPGASYPVTGRFSNASGSQKSDRARDMRGLALKVSQVGADKTEVQDFLMTNGPVHFAKDAAGMMAFAKASAQGGLAMGKYFLSNLKGAMVLLRDTSRKVPSMATESYWSRVPFKIGPKAMKYNVKPCQDEKPLMPKHPSDTYLSDDLRDRASKGPICFEFRVQFQLDADAQPIEDASVEWKESDTPSLPIARVVFPAQTFDSTEQMQACEEMSFSPWHSVNELRPLGNMNRARKEVYPASASFRAAK